MRSIGIFAVTIFIGLCFSLPYALCPEDSTSNTPGNENSSSSQFQENEFQNDVDSLVEANDLEIDTFAWNTQKINSGRFDWRNWDDTAKIVLIDSIAGKSFVAPFENCITSDFGARDWVWHYGVDIRLKKGDSVHSAFNGIVRVIENDRHGYGKVVVVRHSGGLETIYGHLCKTLVSINQAVQAGDIIGLGGSTGRSSGSHLHFETRFYGEAFDPHRLVDFDNFTVVSDTLTLTREDFTYLVDLRKITWHVVRKGETLGLIARRYHTKISALCALNHITVRKLMRVGSKIAVNLENRSDELYTLRPKKQSKV